MGNKQMDNSNTQNMQQERGIVRKTFNGSNIPITFNVYVISSQSF